MSSQANPSAEVVGEVSEDPRSYKFQEKDSIHKGVCVDVIFTDVEHDEVSLRFVRSSRF